MSINYVVLLIFLSVSTGMDLCDGRIYNRWVAGGCFTALLLCIAEELSRLPDRLLGAGIPLALLLLFFRLGMIGGGDVKLLSMTGCFLGAGGILSCMFLSFLVASGFALGRLLAEGTLRKRLRGLFAYAKRSLLSRRMEAYVPALSEKAGMHLSVFILIGVWMYMEGML